MRFYRDVLGLELGRMEPERRVALYWVGQNRNTMLGLWEKPPWIREESNNRVQTQHIAFSVELKDLHEAMQRLKQNGIELKDFFEQVTDEPSVFGWMPAASIYFDDVDGHLLEFIARIDDEPAPDIGVVSLSEWNNLRERSRRSLERRG
jgi:catechol 2,3-dioxygenase-like lactoylglutathione lyase family enzyme